jgi:hypothetical protein
MLEVPEKSIVPVFERLALLLERPEDELFKRFPARVAEEYQKLDSLELKESTIKSIFR